MFRFIFVILSHSRFICLHRLLISSRKGSALLSGFESSISTTFILAILFFSLQRLDEIGDASVAQSGAKCKGREEAAAAGPGCRARRERGVRVRRGSCTFTSRELPPR